MGKRPYTIDPQVAHERAVRAARARTTIDHYIKQVVDRAPELSEEQRERLASILRGGGDAA